MLEAKNPRLASKFMAPGGDGRSMCGQRRDRGGAGGMEVSKAEGPWRRGRCPGVGGTLGRIAHGSITIVGINAIAPGG